MYIDKDVQTDHVDSPSVKVNHSYRSSKIKTVRMLYKVWWNRPTHRFLLDRVNEDQMKINMTNFPICT